MSDRPNVLVADGIDDALLADLRVIIASEHKHIGTADRER